MRLFKIRRFLSARPMSSDRRHTRSTRKRKKRSMSSIRKFTLEATREAFEEIYKILGTKFDYYFLESKVAILGEKLVRENIGEVFEESDEAVVFKGEKHDATLHTRVFITREGLPTYETKELGLTEAKFKEVGDLNLLIVITGNEQKEYMKVVAKALSLIHPEYADKMLHITHGLMRFADRKMSSRTGDVVTGETLIQEVKKKTKDNSDVAVGAIK